MQGLKFVHVSKKGPCAVLSYMCKNLLRCLHLPGIIAEKNNFNGMYIVLENMSVILGSVVITLVDVFSDTIPCASPFWSYPKAWWYTTHQTSERTAAQKISILWEGRAWKSSCRKCQVRSNQVSLIIYVWYLCSKVQWYYWKVSGMIMVDIQGVGVGKWVGEWIGFTLMHLKKFMYQYLCPF